MVSVAMSFFSGVSPPPRSQHTACAWGSVLVVFGGDSSGMLLSDVWIFHTLTDVHAWRLKVPVASSSSGVVLTPPGELGFCNIASSLHHDHQ